MFYYGPKWSHVVQYGSLLSFMAPNSPMIISNEGAILDFAGCAWCGVSSHERVPLAPLGWYATQNYGIKMFLFQVKKSLHNLWESVLYLSVQVRDHCLPTLL